MKCDMCRQEIRQGDGHIFGSLFYSTTDDSKKAVNAGGGLKVHLCKNCHEELARRIDCVRSSNTSGDS